MKKGEFSTCRSQRANPNAKNFGLRSRDINQAAKNALNEKFLAKQIGFKTVATQSNRFTQFSSFIKENFNIRDMRGINREHIIQYAGELYSRIDSGSLSIKSAHEYLSAVNSVLSQAIGNSSLRVTASDAGLPNRSGITTENRAISQIQHDHIKSQLPDRLAAISDMQRELGLRFEEACKNNPAAMYQNAIQDRTVSITEGTKGGQYRVVPIISQVQIDALKSASIIQGRHHSLIPSDQTYSQFQARSYREYTRLGYQTHSERHAYAQDRYTRHMQDQSGVPRIQSPIISGHKHGSEHYKYISNTIGCSIKQARFYDKQARLSVANELGHHRVDITNAYLG